MNNAEREWSLYRIDWVDRTGVCICGKTHISKLVHETGLESYVKSGSAIIRDVPKILRFGYE